MHSLVEHTPAQIFADACEAQGVTQQTGVEKRRGIVSMAYKFHRATIEWGISRKALDGPLDIDQMPDLGPVRTLGALANVASGYAEGVTSELQITRPSALKNSDGSCPNAEKFWDATVDSINNGKPALAEVYLGTNGKAAAIRKGRGAVPTALLLQPVSIIDGKNKPFTYLPGSLVHLSAADDETRIIRQGSTHKLQVPDAGIVRPWSDVVGMDYVRETPVAYDDNALVKHESYTEVAAFSHDNPWRAVQTLAQHIIEHA
jgi:hypothetical protein